jgi:hypothetical protein
MTERKQLASNIVRRHTSLDPDQARLHIRKPGTNPAASKLLSQNDRPLLIQANQSRLPRSRASICARSMR